MRTLALALALAAFATHAQAQRSPIRPHLSLAGGAGSGGAAARLAFGLERGLYTSEIRFAADGLGDTAPAETRQRAVELGSVFSRIISVSQPISLRGGLGYAVGITSVDDQVIDEGPIPDISGLAYMMSLPVEAEVQLHANDFVALTLGGYRSFVLKRWAPDGSRAATADLGHGGVLIGLRMRR